MSCLTGSQEGCGNVDTRFPRKGWLQCWLSEAVGALPPPGRGQTLSQEIKGVFVLESLAWMGPLDFSGAPFTEFCGEGKKLIYTKIPDFFYSQPHMSLGIIYFPPCELLIF